MKGPAQVERGPQLRGGEGVHGQQARAAGQQVGAAATQLACARTRQHEAAAPLLDEPVHRVEQGRQALHLVDDHGGRGAGAHQRFEPVRAQQQLAVEGGVEQVEHQRVRKGLPEPGGLAGTAWPQEEEAGRFGRPEEPGNHVAVFTRKTATRCSADHRLIESIGMIGVSRRSRPYAPIALSARIAAQAAPYPLSMLVTVSPGEHDANIACRAVIPPAATP